MADVLVFAANVLDSDRQGPRWGASDERRDYSLMLFHDRALPSIKAQLAGLGAQVEVVSTDELAWEDVYDAMGQHPDAIVVVFGHGVPPDKAPAIYNRRKEPRRLLADERVVGVESRWQHLVSCYSHRLCEHVPAGERKPVICFCGAVFTPVPHFLEEDFPGQPAYQEVVLKGYEYAFASPVVLAFQSGQPVEAVEKAKVLLRQTVEACREMLEQTHNNHCVTYAEIFERMIDVLCCV